VTFGESVTLHLSICLDDGLESHTIKVMPDSMKVTCVSELAMLLEMVDFAKPATGMCKEIERLIFVVYFK
jgi:hypothetical protein